jgi:hypothetical protein
MQIVVALHFFTYTVVCCWALGYQVARYISERSAYTCLSMHMTGLNKITAESDTTYPFY